MTVIQALILGIIQGLAEFLPISSSGHLVLLQRIFGIDEGTLTFDVILHIGTLIPVFIVFKDEIIGLIKKPFQRLTLLLIVGTLPAVIAALFFGDIIEKLFEGGLFLAVGFFITGVFLLYADRAGSTKKREEHMSVFDALIIGLMQALAICPAISRSGSTITGALLRNVERETAARFSFLLSIPAIAGALVLQIKKLVTGEVTASSIDIIPTVVGFAAAAVCGYFAIRFMLKLIKDCKLKYFSYYVFILCGLILLDNILFKMFF